MSKKIICPPSSQMPKGCDVLVIGAGMSGLSTALELSERGVRNIIVADHGPFDGFEHRTRTANQAPLPGPPAPWKTTSPNYADFPGVVSPVGGRSRCWHGVVLPISSAILDRHWPKQIATRLLGEDAGSYAAMLWDLRQWQSQSGVITPVDAGTEGTLRHSLRALWPEYIMAPVPQMGMSADGPNGPEVWAYSPLLAWHNIGLDRHRCLDLPLIVPGAAAIQVLVDKGRVTGALFSMPDGETWRVDADFVVLAAGTLENTRLYAQAYSAMGDTITRWPGLNDHVTHGYIVPLPDALKSAWQRYGNGFLWSDTEVELHANFFVEVHSSGLSEPIMDAWWMANQENPFDEIRFNPAACETTANGASVWSAEIESSLSAADHSAIQRRSETTQQLLGNLSCTEFQNHVLPDTDEAIERALSTREAVPYVNPLGTAHHESGTVPLGRELGFGGQSPWAPNLFMTGPATFPIFGAANPTLTMLALAGQTADTIVTGRHPSSV